MRVTDKCPSCQQPVAPTDFLCAHCELILQPGLAPDKPVDGDISVVRRMLEEPQAGIPTALPSAEGPPGKPREATGATRTLTLPEELKGVPVVVASLTRRPEALTEFEAWVTSLVDGQCDAEALAEKLGMNELELRVVLLTLRDKQVIEFAPEPLPDVEVEVDEGPGAAAHTLQPPASMMGASRPAPAPAPPAAVPTTPAAGRQRAPSSAELLPVLVPARRELGPPVPDDAEAQPPGRHDRTDPRIAYSGHANRKVLEALKQVKRRSDLTPAEPRRAVGPKSAPSTAADVLAQDSLQLALRMEQSGRLDEAIKHLERSIARSPDAPSLYNRLGVILMRERGDFRRAEKLFTQAKELAPDNDVYATNLQHAIARLALSKHR